MKILDFFDRYVAIGLKPIALYKQSKTPISKGWYKNWSIDKWRCHFASGKFNMGIILGDIVDVEGDSPEANEILNKIIGSYPHPKFSSCKSVHHLFKNPDKDLTRIAHQGIEFRANNHQSVVPPSIHENNIRYRWIQGSIFEIPEMPSDLLNFYNGIKSLRKISLPPLKNKPFYSTVCKSCNKRVKIHKKRLALEVKAFSQFGLSWACRDCRKLDIRPICRKLKRQS